MDNPVDCTADPVTFGTCIRGKYGPKESLFIVVILFQLTLLMLIVNLLRVTAHFYTAEKLVLAENVEDNNDTAGRASDLLPSSVVTATRSTLNRQDTNYTQSLTMQSFVQHNIAVYFSRTLLLIWYLSWQWQGYLGPAGLNGIQ
jgi:hypothetical protein